MPRTVEGRLVPALTVDIVVRRGDEVVLIRRGREPFAGRWALPGGFVDHGETVEHAAVREAREETGLEVRLVRLVGVYSAPDRDPRHHTVTVVFLAIPHDPDEHLARGGDDAADARWFPIDDLPPLAFDHDQILRDALLLPVPDPAHR